MSKIYKVLLATLLVSISFTAFAQQGYWSARADRSGIVPDKAVSRLAYPKTYLLYDLDIAPLRQQLFTIVDRPGQSTTISLPSAEGKIETFNVWEASNFVPELQAHYPEIRAFSGKGSDGSLLKLSISPQGVSTMVTRVDGSPTEFMEPYSADHHVYSVYQSQRPTSALPWVCSTPDQQLATDINNVVSRVESSTGEARTMRLAQSVNGEYSNYFGAFNSSQSALVYAAINATLSRCNGCYEKDLAIHLNLISNFYEDQIIFYDPATDPYTTLGAWNGQLQNLLNNVVGDANYDIGHMFGASGGGGNAGCIGCVCVAGQKGSGITSPADGIPMGDNFDIDYVVHEVGHQFGGNHSFTFSNEGTVAQKEVGAGITIMGYAGITAYDPAPHSIDIYTAANIAQIQANMAIKTCPVVTNITANNATPVVAALNNYTIPMQTPFALTGSATDANAGDVLTYCWEQNDLHGGNTGANSVAFATKLLGPNFIAFSPTTNPTRLFPKLSTILAGLQITPPLPGGDAICNIEALSSVGRTETFRLTVRDNCPYVPTVKIGQTAFQDMTLTIDGTTGPFAITSQNSAVSYAQGTSQTVTWSVNGTAGAPINCANVKISWSSDGGNTFSTLIASTPNDGTENFTVPGPTTTTGRIKVEAIGNIFFDINNANITVTVPLNGFTFNSPAPVVAACPAPNTMTSGNLTASYAGTFTGNIDLTGTVSPAGPTVSFSQTTLTTGSPSSTVSLTGMSTLAPGTWTVTVTGTPNPPVAGVPPSSRDIVFTINPGSGPAVTVQPTNQTQCSGGNSTFCVTAPGTTGYQWQLSTAGCGGPFVNVVNGGIYSGANTSCLTITGATTTQNGYAYRAVVSGQCGSTNSNCVTLTVNAAPAITLQPISQAVCSGSAVTFNSGASGAGVTYQWQISTNGGITFTDIAGATANAYTIASTTLAMNGNQYHLVASGSCPPSATSANATLTVNSSVTVTTNPTNQTICEGTGTTFTSAATGSGLNYQWQVSTDGGVTWNNVSNGPNYSGATTPTLTLINTPPTFNGYRYRDNITSPPCTPGITTSALLTVNSFPVITTNPVNVTICEGGTPSFTVVATTSVGSLSYQWQLSTNGGATWTNIAGATNATYAPPLIPIGANGYMFRVVVTAGCGSSNSGAATLTVNAYPVFTFVNLPKNVCRTDPSFTLSATIAGGVWTGTGVIAGGIFSPAVSGVGVRVISYTVSNAGCVTTNTSAVTVDECTGRHRLLNQKDAVLIAPNPNTGQFNLIMNSDLYSKLGVKIYGADGKLYKTLDFASLTYGSVIPMDLTMWGQGTYYLYMYNSENGFISRGDGVVIFHH